MYLRELGFSGKKLSISLKTTSRLAFMTEYGLLNVRYKSDN